MDKCKMEGTLQEIYGENGFIYIRVKDNKPCRNTIYNAIKYQFKDIEVIIKEKEVIEWIKI